MASSSFSSQEKHDVFLSFRGEDTRFGFASNLYHALRKKGIQTYMDNQELKSGHEISPQLKKAIQESNICIIVLSKNFASSTWCLIELVDILECKGENVTPIFYDIDPSIVRKQSDSYADAFATYEQRFKDEMEKVKQWRGALEKLANLSGYDSKNFRDEHELVGKIAEDIFWKFPKYQLTNYGHIFGIEEPVKKIESLLSIGEMDVRIIGIWGMGGIGKTTLAEIVYQRCSYSYFDGYCFVKDIPEGADNTNELRHTLLSELLEDQNLLRMDTPGVGSRFIQDRLRCKKVFIVLDNLNGRSSKLNDLFQGYQLANGSRIIVTSRDKQLLMTKNCQIYQLKGLCHRDALQLFCFHAFAPNSPPTPYEALLESVVHYAGGNPLALKLLGSSLKYKSVEEWKSAFDKLKRDPDPHIQKVLRISYDGLGDKSIQGIFLDIACFFNDRLPRAQVESILNHTDATIGISVLIDKSLISESGGILRMHDLLLQMARAIVYDENKDCGYRSRLWNNKDSCHVLERNTGTSAIEGISLNQSELRKDVKVNRMAFSKMFNLRFLKLHSDYTFDHLGWRQISPHRHFRLRLPDGLEPFVSDELKYFQWDAYPLKSLPYCNPENLVQLIMHHSQLELLWNEDQPLELVKLEKIDLSYSKHLMQISNLSRAINLQHLNLQGCRNLVKELRPLPHGLRTLNIRECERLKSLPELPSSLYYLNANECSSLEELPPLPHGLLRLVIRKCERLKSLPELPSSLYSLDPKECSSLEELPPLPHGLITLDIGKCERLKSLPELPSFLHDLYANECSSLEELPPLPHCLHRLNIEKCERLKSLPELPSSLHDLYANECSSLEELPPLPHRLQELHIEKCERLKSIAELPSSLIYLYAKDCTSLETISSWGHATAQRGYDSDAVFSFGNCIKLDGNTINNVIADHVSHRFLSAHEDIPCVYPGDEIPEWFDRQSGGQDSINIDLRPNWFKLGLRFSICFVYVVLNGYYNQPIKVEYEFNFKAKTSNGDDLLYKHGGALTQLDGSITDSDHVLITTPYNFRGFFWPIYDDELLKVFGRNWSSICRNITEASFRVFHEDQNGVIVNIKKIGIHLHNYGFEEPNVDGDSTSKRGFDECSSDQPNGYQHNHESHPHNTSKRIKLMGQYNTVSF